MNMIPASKKLPVSNKINSLSVNYFDTLQFMDYSKYTDLPSILLNSGISRKEKTLFDFCLLMKRGNSNRAKNVMFSTIERYHKKTCVPKIPKCLPKPVKLEEEKH